MTDPASRVRELMKEGMLCAESVLMAVAEAQGLDSPLIPRIATGLCGGMSRTNRLCGAVTGGVLAVSLAHGRDNASQSHEEAYSFVQEYLERFERRFGASDCPTLCGCDLSTPEGKKAFRENQVIDKCADMAAQAAALAWDTINERGE
jgi:C_GCAxxG_C_C family probable redox protein